MNKIFPIDLVQTDNNWDDSALAGTEPYLPVSDEINQDEIDTLREIECALEVVERISTHNLDDAIDSCTNPTRRTEFPAAAPINDEE